MATIRKRAAAVVEPPSDMSEDLLRLVELRDNMKVEKVEAEAIAHRLLQSMQDNGYKPNQKLSAVRPDGVTVYGQIVQGTSLIIDESKLKRRLGPALWNRITTRILDRRKLDAFIASGEISPTVIATVSTKVPTTPYIKVGK